MKKFLQEFRDFAMRGNVVDLAVGVIIGAAFGKIVSSLTEDILMPILGLFVGKVSFTNLKWDLTPEASIAYGKFIQVTFDFVILAFAIFLMVRTMNRMRKQEEAAPAAAPEPSAEEKLLTEIRDLLKQQR